VADCGRVCHHATGRAVAEELPTKPSLSHLQIVFNDTGISFKVEDSSSDVVDEVKPGGTYFATVSTRAAGESGTSEPIRVGCRCATRRQMRVHAQTSCICVRACA